jgi:hypothetical protein
MIPIHFGPSDRPLFGVYHPPEGGHASGPGVVLCYPLGQEYQRSHRLFRQLSTLLSKAGLPVLRFDYVGTGDSAGEAGEGAPTQWRENITTAANELRDLGAVPQVSAVGLRLGAALAASVDGPDRTFNTLVLWDPVVSGRDYLSSLRAMHVDVLRNEHPGGAWVTAEDRTGEVLGMLLSERMRVELEQIDLLALSKYSGRRVAVVVSETRGSYTDLYRRLEQLGQDCAYFHVPGAGDWQNRSSRGTLLSEPSILERITAVLAAPT